MDEAAREARRQRILANSEKRLQRILGLSTSPTSPEQNDTETEIKPLLQNVIEQSQAEHSQSQSEGDSQQYQTRYRGKTEQVKQTTDLSTEEVLPTNLPETIFGQLNTKQAKKGDIESSLQSMLVLLAITTITILNFGFGTVIGNSVMVPFFGFEIYRIFIKRENQLQSDGLFNTALMLSGIPQDKLTLGLKMKDIFTIFFRDLCIYLFVSLICYRIYQVWL